MTALSKNKFTLERIILFIAFCLILFVHSDYGASWDEPTHVVYAKHVINYFLTWGRDETALTYSNLYLYGPMFDVVSQIVYKNWPGSDIYDVRHLCSAICGIFMSVGLYKIGRYLFGNWCGWLAALAVATQPYLIGHFFINTKDTSFAAGYIWSVYYLIRIANDRLLSWQTILKCALALGMALSIRVGGLFVFGYLGLALLLRLIAKNATLAQASGLFIAILLIAWTIMVVTWPWVHQSPVLKPIEAFQVMRQFPWSGLVRFRGELISNLDLPWYYAPLHYVLKSPEAHLAFFSLGAFYLFRDRLFRSPGVVILITTLLFPLVMLLALKMVVYDEIRHFFFVNVLSSVFVGFGASRLLATFKYRKFIKIAYVLLFLCPLVAVIRFHPYQYTYFNDLFAGGAVRGMHEFEADYWATSFRELVAKFENRIAAESIDSRSTTIAFDGPAETVQYRFKSTFRTVALEESPDFVLVVNRAGNFARYDQRRIYTSVNLLGTDLSAVFDMRGIK